MPSGTQTGAFNATITFSETVSGFAQSDVSLSGSAASITGWSSNSDNTVYTATITSIASGAVTISVAANVATDAANNPNTAATSQTVTVSVDVDAPGVSISVPSGDQTNAFEATITFTETVSGFEQGRSLNLRHSKCYHHGVEYHGQYHLHCYYYTRDHWDSDAQWLLQVLPPMPQIT